MTKNILKIKELFPNCVTEAKDKNDKITLKIDFETLKQELSDDVIGENQEKYEFTWPGKKESILLANQPTDKILLPCKEESVNWDTTQNLYIEGDNLDVLKILRRDYLNKIKMIYIDPPYNTGFSGRGYRDKFTHSEWLNMMYPRLKLARDLLTDDGVIFISIDNHEQANLKKICDDIFGEYNYIDSIVWDKKSSAKGVPPQSMMVNVHEYIVAYHRNGLFSFVGEKRNKADFKNPDNDPRGPWRESNIKSTTKSADEAFTIVDPNTGKKYTNTWAFSKASLEQMILEGRILWKKSLPRQKEYMYEMTNENKAIKSSWGVFDAQSTTVFLKNLLPEFRFDNPKPIRLMQYLLSVSARSNNIILDFFSGSATTAHAVMKLNAEDGGNRKFIMVQLPEPCNEKSEAFKEGYKNICEIGKERIRRAGKKIIEETGKTDLDIGFRVFKIQRSS